MKRYLLLIGSAVLLASLIGCGSSDEAAGDMTPPKGAEAASMNAAGAGNSGGGGAKVESSPAQAPN